METVAAFTQLGGVETPLQATVLGVDNHSMQLKLPRWIDIGSAIKVEADDTLTLGEVSHCQPDGDGYLVWVELCQSLYHVGELARLARALLA